MLDSRFHKHLSVYCAMSLRYYKLRESKHDAFYIEHNHNTTQQPANVTYSPL